MQLNMTPTALFYNKAKKQRESSENTHRITLHELEMNTVKSV